MPQNEAAALDPLAGGSFSRLLFSNVEAEDAVKILGLDDHHRRHHLDNTNGGGAGHFAFGDNRKPPKMLCFGSDYISSSINGVSAVSSTTYSTTTITDDNNNSSSPPSTTNSTTTSLSSNSNMKRDMRRDYYQPIILPNSFAATSATASPARSSSRNCKKMRTEKTPPVSHAKVKKEKLGERIAALQQIVSPYGKTDTASVLHEAMGYIKFLQEQVQVLCSPYLQRPTSTHIEGEEDEDGGEKKKDLGSKGLCLVPVECTLHVAESNGADLWSPAMVNRHDSSVLH
ncbi:unnamed protein product [Lactuca virosa]|uniref:BHLH domain-containing protein n=1 Tax=Lactuca virosa TaxID=75947 RepID=A0AAU9PL75_9ASTR|nr:unnamed protein product [Lactuca virosa]